MAKREKTKHKGIYKVGDIYYITYYADGKKYEKAAGAKLGTALDQKREMERKAQKGKYAIVDRMEKTTFKELMNLYKEKGDNKSYILRFQNQYLNYFGQRKLSSISRSDLFDFRDKCKGTPRQLGGGIVTNSNVNRAMAGLRRLLNFGVAQEYLEESPFPRDPKNRILEESAKPIYPLYMKRGILIGYYTGMRDGESELLGLRWAWIDFESGIIRLPKTKTLNDPDSRGQEIVMQKELAKYLKSIPVESEYVLCLEDGSRVRHWHFYKRFKKILEAIGVDPKDYAPKEIRHTTGTLMYLRGAQVKAIADQLRHDDQKTTTDFYIGADPDYQRSQNELLVIQNQNAQA
jgi:integrase